MEVGLSPRERSCSEEADEGGDNSERPEDEVSQDIKAQAASR